ncbi:MAG: T9SS type A sorting domain-containing protein [Flavobacteriales bacterium]|nr:T9SS type A sorting domain-containing protein [Flavobacteriales bacterium]
MKRTLLGLGAFALISSLSAQTILIYEDFDAQTSGALVAQTLGAPWNTWGQAPGGSEDTPISDEQAYSGTLSMKVSGVAAGGPTDLILELGDRTTGLYGLSWYMYIPTGSGGYFNIQHNQVPGAGSWMNDITFLPDGTIEYLVNAVTATGTYPHDQWFNVIMVLDLINMQGTVAIDGTIQYTWMTDVPGPSQLGGIDFFAYAGGAPNVPLFYVDDVSFIQLPSQGLEEAVEASFNTYPNPTEGNVVIEWTGASANALVDVLDMTGRVLVAPRTAQRIGIASRTQVDLSAFSEGMYFVRLRDGSREEVRRVIKH